MGKHSKTVASSGVPNALVVAMILLVFVTFGFYWTYTWGFTEKPEIFRKAAVEPSLAATSTVSPSQIETEPGWEIVYQDHEDGKILDNGLPKVPKSKAARAKLPMDVKKEILKVAKHDPAVLRYYLGEFGYPRKNIPSEKELVSDLPTRQGAYFSLKGILMASRVKSGKTYGDWYNDGMTPSGRRTAQPTSYGSKGADAYEVETPGGDKVYVKRVCGNVQHVSAPKGAKMLRRRGKKPRRPQKPCFFKQKPPRNKFPWTTPHHPGNPSTQNPQSNTGKAGPTPGVTRGTPESTRQSQDANSGNPDPAPGGKTGQGTGGTTDPGGGTTPAPPPTTPPDTTDPGPNEGDPGMPD